MKDFSSRSFLLLAHYATFAYQDLLFSYLTKNKAKIVTKMNFPLPELPNLKNLEITVLQSGKKEKIIKKKSFYSPVALAYILQSLQLLQLVIFSKPKYDVVIAEDSLLAALSIILRLFGKCHTVIFYSHGIDKSRFNNKLMNWLYQKLDFFAATKSDYNWFLNRNMYALREKQGISKNRLFWIPASISIKTINRKPGVFNHKIVFLGVLNKKNGAHLLTKIIQEVSKKIPAVELTVIGNGDLDQKIKEEIKNLHLEKHIKLLGVLEFKDFCKILTNYSIGLAPYEDVFDTLTVSSDSMKMRVYLAAGLPVVITKGFIFSDELVENNLGYAVDFKVSSFTKSIVKLLSDKKLNQDIRKRALLYSKKHDIENIYNETFGKIFSTFHHLH